MCVAAEQGRASQNWAVLQYEGTLAGHTGLHKENRCTAQARLTSLSQESLFLGRAWMDTANTASVVFILLCLPGSQLSSSAAPWGQRHIHSVTIKLAGLGTDLSFILTSHILVLTHYTLIAHLIFEWWPDSLYFQVLVEDNITIAAIYQEE